MKLYLFPSHGLQAGEKREQAHLLSVPQKWLNPISPKYKVGKLCSDGFIDPISMQKLLSGLGFLSKIEEFLKTVLFSIC